tara:strand:+ start:3204 stop:3458 length:255 start_codon:yes stop_codon:yes gene_type:complete
MKAFNKYILIEEIKEEITSGGLFVGLDDVKQLRYKKGKIKIPGTQVDVVKEGDTIYYDSRAGHIMLIEDEPYTIISEGDIVVIL